MKSRRDCLFEVVEMEITTVSDVETRRGLTELDVGTLFHCILFAYQKALKDILGTGSAVFVHPVLKTVTRMSERQGINLIRGETIDEVFDNLSRLIEETGFLKEFRFEKLGPEKYVLHLDGCVWASHIPEELKPKDVTCPFALLAMSIFEKVLNGRVRVADSEYFKTGTRTRIELL